MIDIHNEVSTSWGNMPQDVREEIIRQESLGGLTECFDPFSKDKWKPNTEPANSRALNCYRIRPGTEVPPASTRPADEMDLTQLCKPFGLLHAETREALLEWPHGWTWFTGSTSWESLVEPCWSPSSTYRAKPAPKPNLIERGRIEPFHFAFADPTPIWYALDAADALIATMSGGDPDLRKAYDEAIK